MKIIRIAITAFAAVILLTSRGFAQISETPETPITLYDNADITGALPDEALEIADNLNVTPDEGALNLTFGGVMSEIRRLMKSEVTKPLKLFASLCAVILLCSLAEALRDSSNGSGAVKAFETAGVLAGAGMISGFIAESVVRTSGVLSAAGAFMLTLIPILAGIMAVMGQMTAAGLFNSSVIVAAQIFSEVMAAALMPLSATILGVSVASAVTPDLETGKLASAVKTVVIWVLGFSATVFTGLLTVQSLVASAADSVAMKAVKFTVSGGVPIVGGAVSDAIGIAANGLALLKSTTGAFGIIALAAVCLPPLLSAVCFRLALTAAGAVSDLFGVKRLGTLIKSAENVMSIILAMIICFSMVMLVSIALMLKMGGGQ